jgi:competence protein ComEC
LRLRQAIVERLQVWLADDPALPFVAGLAAGDRSQLSEADWAVFRITGTSHLMAIAGLHIGMVVTAVFFAARWFWALVPWLCLRLPAQKAGMLAAVAAAGGYALLSGFEPPAQRALLMLLLGFLALWTERPADLPRMLALAWIAIVAANPLALLSPGLWLSFTAVAAIYYVISGRLQGGGGWRAFLRIQLGLSLALVPLTIFFFQGGGWIGPLANLLVVPVFTLLLPALLLGVAAAWAWPAAGVPALRLAAHGVLLVREALGWAAAHAPHAWIAANPEAPALMLALIGIAAMLAPRGVPLRPFALLCVVPLLLHPERAPAAGFRLAALDVGQGLAVVVRTAGHALLFDAGPAFGESADAGRTDVIPYLLEEGIDHLDMMMISHADMDHRGGAPAVRSALPVADEVGAISPIPCAEGQQWVWDGVAFEVLSPPEAFVTAPPPTGDGSGETNRHAASRNNTGCVLRISAGGHAALLPADIEAPAERRLVGQPASRLRADVLLAPHHGSKTSSTPEFVQAVAPKIVIFPSGWHNRFDFPRAAVVDRYRAAGAELHMTGNEGTVSVLVTADATGEVHGWRRDHPRLWRQLAEAVPQDNQ